MTGCFVRALWGDFQIPNFQHVVDEVKWCLAQPHQPEPTFWYAYGEANRDFLAGLGLSPVPMSSGPFVRWFGDEGKDEQPLHYATIRYGSAMWRMKYPAIRHALETHLDAVWLDLDTVLTQPLPMDFWERMRAGNVFQCTLQQNHKRRAGWRPDDNEPRKTPGGNWQYFRGIDAIDRLLRIYSEHPDEWDLTVLARLVDELMGGTWKGSAAYKELGYEPYCHSLGHYEKRQIHKPEVRLFKTEWRKPRLTKSGKSEPPWVLAKGK